MSTMFGITSWDEDKTSPQFAYMDGGKIEITQTGTINWNDNLTFINNIMPLSQVFGSRNSPSIGIAFPDFPDAHAATYTIMPFPGSAVRASDANGINTYDLAQVVIKYRNNEGSENQTDPTSFLTHEWNSGGEYLPLPKRNLFYAIDGSPVGKDATFAQFIPTIEHNITWPRVESPPFAAIRAAMGTANSAAITFITGDIAFETLLFTGAQLSRDFMSDGTGAWRIQYKFAERNVVALDQDGPGGWNHFYRSKGIAPGGGFYRVKALYTSLPIYPLSDHTLLFQAE